MNQEFQEQIERAYKAGIREGIRLACDDMVARQYLLCYDLDKLEKCLTTSPIKKMED